MKVYWPFIIIGVIALIIWIGMSMENFNRCKNCEHFVSEHPFFGKGSPVIVCKAFSEPLNGVPYECSLYKKKIPDNIKRCKCCQHCVSITNEYVQCTKYKKGDKCLTRSPDYCSLFKEDEHNGR